VINRRELVERKIALEFGVAPVGDTLPAARANADGQPRLLVSQFDNEHAVFFRFDVPPERREQLSQLGPDTLMYDDEQVRTILAHDKPSDKVYRIRWHIIERLPDRSEFPDVTLRDDRHVIIIDGRAVAWARTDNEDDCAAEVSIETLEAFRRRGFARQVTASWAASVLSAGKVAYYSHLLANAPSQAVASSLGLTHLSDEVEYL